MRTVFKTALAIVAAVAALTGRAADVSVSTTGVLSPFSPADGSSYLEVWGQGSNTRYALPATDPGDLFHGLIAAAETAAQARLASTYSLAAASWVYDPAALATSVSASGNSARYPMGPLSVTIGSGLGAVQLSTPDTRLSVVRSSNHHTQVLNFNYALPTVDGPLAGTSFSFPVPGGAVTPVDLVALLGPSAYYQSGFDLGAFSTLPVRLTSPSVLRPVYLGVSFTRSNPAADFGIEPPAQISLADYPGAVMQVAFDGVFGFGVERSDFVSDAEFATARDWVQANLRQVNYEVFASWSIDGLQTAAVPEPAVPALWLLGLGVLLPLARHQRRIG